MTRLIHCPICSGPLELDDAGHTCDAGHRFDDAQLGADRLATVRRALWSAVRALEDEVIRARWQADRPGATELWASKADDADAAAETLRTFAARWDAAGEGEPRPGAADPLG